jgi:hypothetical protein
LAAEASRCYGQVSVHQSFHISFISSLVVGILRYKAALEEEKALQQEQAGMILLIIICVYTK